MEHQIANNVAMIAKHVQELLGFVLHVKIPNFYPMSAMATADVLMGPENIMIGP